MSDATIERSGDRKPGADFARVMAEHGPGAVIPPSSIHDTLPPRRPLSGLWDFVVRGARPAGLWVGLLVLFVHGVVLPIAALCGRTVQGFNATELLGICALVGLGWHQRTKEKREGLTS